MLHQSGLGLARAADGRLAGAFLLLKHVAAQGTWEPPSFCRLPDGSLIAVGGYHYWREAVKIAATSEFVGHANFYHFAFMPALSRLW